MPTAYWIILFMSSCLLSVFYWHVIQPVHVRKAIFRLFRRRDRLRRLAIMSQEDHDCPAYREVEDFICKTISIVPAVSLASFLLFVIRNRDEKNDGLKKLTNGASHEID